MSIEDKPATATELATSLQALAKALAKAKAYCAEPVPARVWVLLNCWREGDGYLVENSLAAIGYDRDSMVKLAPPDAVLADLDHADRAGGIRQVYRIVEVPTGVNLEEMLDTQKRNGR